MSSISDSSSVSSMTMALRFDVPATATAGDASSSSDGGSGRKSGDCVATGMTKALDAGEGCEGGATGEEASEASSEGPRAPLLPSVVAAASGEAATATVGGREAARTSEAGGGFFLNEGMPSNGFGAAISQRSRRRGETSSSVLTSLAFVSATSRGPAMLHVCTDY